MVFITYMYSDEMCQSVYSSDYENSALLNTLIINIFLQFIFSQQYHRWNEKSLVIFGGFFENFRAN